jgi:HD superfamily phosphohydrolase YqeK
LHGPVGAYLVQKELGMTDELILGAIISHTYYGSSPYFNHPLSWCMRFSDFLEANRDWSDIKLVFTCVERLRILAYAGEMEEGAFLHAAMLIKWYESTNTPVHPNMRRVKAELGNKLGLDDSYLAL